VCENHLDKPWDLDLGCICGAGVPCKCNETDGIDEPDVSQVIVEDPPRRHRGVLTVIACGRSQRGRNADP
jgi:hypothetical protein